MDENLKTLLARRSELLQKLAQTGDMRQGSIAENYRRCGKPTCHCASRGDPGHGPYFAFTRHRRFRQQCQELVELNEKICDARSVEDEGEQTAGVKKIVEIIQQEVDRLVSMALRDRHRCGSLDLEALEMAVRDCMHQIGGVLLSQLLAVDGGDHRGPRVECSQGHRAEFVGYRNKTVTTVVAPVEIRRAYYHCSTCQAGVVPKDQRLDVVASSFSPGVRRMMAHVGGREPFEQGCEDLEQLAGIALRTKQIERVAEATGALVRAAARVETEAVWNGRLVGLPTAPRIYLAIDATGVPIVPWELKDRPGKDPQTGPCPGASPASFSGGALLANRIGSFLDSAEARPPMSELSRPPNNSVAASTLRRCVEACSRSKRSWCWAMALPGSGISRKRFSDGDPDPRPLPCQRACQRHRQGGFRCGHRGCQTLVDATL